MKKIINILIVLTIFFLLADCYLILPLKYYPLYKNNNSTEPEEMMQAFVSTKIYAEIDIGTPRQKIEIPLDFNSNDFYIADSAEKIFAEKPKLFSDIKFYVLSNSNYPVIFI